MSSLECTIPSLGYAANVLLFGMAVGISIASWTCVVAYVLLKIDLNKADESDVFDFRKGDLDMKMCDFLAHLIDFADYGITAKQWKSARTVFEMYAEIDDEVEKEAIVPSVRFVDIADFKNVASRCIMYNARYNEDDTLGDVLSQFTSDVLTSGNVIDCLAGADASVLLAYGWYGC